MMKKISTVSVFALLLAALFAAGCAQEAYTITATVNVKDVDGKAVSGAGVNAYSPYNITVQAGGQATSITGDIQSYTSTDDLGVAKLQLAAGKYGFRASKGTDTTGVAEADIGNGKANIVSITIRKLPAGQQPNTGAPTQEELEAAAKKLSGPPANPAVPLK